MHTTPLIPLEDFFRHSERTGFQLSPDGKHLAWLSPWNDRLNLFVRRLDQTDAEAVRLTSETARSLAGYLWADNERLVYAKDTGGDENYQLFGVRLDGEDLRAYTPFPGVRASQPAAAHVVVQSAPPTVVVEQNSEYAATMRQLADRLNEPFVTANTVTGDHGIQRAQEEYDRLIRNKSPKSRK